MAIVLGPNRYGKAETRVVRIVRDAPRHEIIDLNVSSALRGAFEPAHLEGDQSRVLPTDTQKNTAYAWAKLHVPDPIEPWALSYGRHLLEAAPAAVSARIEVERFDWERVTIDGAPHDHTWTRRGDEVRTAAVTIDGSTTHVVQGLKDLVILKSTGSHFRDFLVDEYTTLQPTDDRVMATSLVAQWRLTDPAEDVDWNAMYAGVRSTMVRQFAELESYALQQTLWYMGRAALEAYPAIAEIRLSAPNKHHFVYDLERFGIGNDNEVLNADDRPYGLIQASALRDDAPAAGEAWDSFSGLV